MKSKMRMIFSLLIMAVAIMYACKKSDQESLYIKSPIEEKFLSLQAGAPGPINKIVNTLGAYNKKYNFIEKLAKEQGYAQWNKSPLIFNSKSNSIGREDNSKDTIVIVPLVKSYSKRVSAFLICRVGSEKIDIRLLRGDRYNLYPINNRIDTLSASFIASQIMYLDNLVFGHDKFKLMDDRILDYPEVQKQPNGNRYLYLKSQHAGAKESGTIFITGTSCQDVYISGGDLTGVPPGGTPDYGHWETQCFSYTQMVQVFNYGDGGGSGGSIPPPPDGGGGGGTGTTTTLTSYFWNDDPCDPNGWQTPDSQCQNGVVGWQPINIVVSPEFTPNLPAVDPDEQWWHDNTTTFPSQTLPSWANMDANYPKDASGNDMPATDVYKLIGGDILAMRNANPQKFLNACAARVSRALNYSGVTIPYIPNQTFKGADNKYYFLGAAKLYNWMIKTFGNTNAIEVTQAQGGPNGSLFNSYLSGNKGIFLMQPVNQQAFGASGHATLYSGSGCVGGPDHCFFEAEGGVAKVILFKLN